MFIPSTPSSLWASSKDTSTLKVGSVATTRRAVRLPRPSPICSPNIFSNLLFESYRTGRPLKNTPKPLTDVRGSEQSREREGAVRQPPGLIIIRDPGAFGLGLLCDHLSDPRMDSWLSGLSQ